MQNKNSAPRTEFDEQLRLYSDDLSPSSLHEKERIDAFDTQIRQPSNRKPKDGKGELTLLTDLTANRKGVYVAHTRARSRAHPLGACTFLPFRTRQIRQIRQIARRRRYKIGGFRPRGVKSVKSLPVSDSGVTA